MLNMTQASLGLDWTNTRTRARNAIEERVRVMPWAALVALIGPHSPWARTGWPPFAIDLTERHGPGSTDVRGGQRVAGHQGAGGQNGTAMNATMDLTRFRGHATVMGQGVRDAQKSGPVPGGVANADDRAGARRQGAFAARPRVRLLRLARLPALGTHGGMWHA